MSLRIAVVGVGFMLARTVSLSLSLGIAADHQRDVLRALDRVPPGSRVAALRPRPVEPL